MSIRVKRLRELKLEERSNLERRLADYYSNAPQSYYEIADRAATQYQPAVMPFHCDLVRRISPGMSILEVGCGTAHLCPFTEAAGANYTGLDYGEEVLNSNRRRFPNAGFFPVGTALPQQFDMVVSLYAIEHVADPVGYLKQMFDQCKPGGSIAIICPDFVDGEGISPSIFFGKTPWRFREKIGSLRLFDACQHLVDWLYLAPKWKRTARKDAPGAFWINLNARILAGAEYSIDADAVHLPRLKDLTSWLEQQGASIETTSNDFTDADPIVLRYNCYVVARKP